MARQAIQILRMTDRQVVEGFRAIAAVFAPTSEPTLYIRPVQSIPELSVSLKDAENEPAIKALLESDAAGCQELWVSMHGADGNAFTAKIERPAFDGSTRPQVEVLEITMRDQVPPQAALAFTTAAARAFREYESIGTVSSLLGREMGEFYDRREGQLRKLEELTHRILEDTEKHRRGIDAEMQRHKVALDEQARLHKDKLDVEHGERLAAAGRRDAEFEELKKQLDDRSNLHARRELRQDLKREIENRGGSFALTAGTQRKRRPTHALFGALVVVLAAASIEASVMLFRVLALNPIPTTALIAASVRLTFALAGLVATLVFYIRWTDRWFEKHAHEEFKLKRLYLDIDRASWVVEMAHEWAGAKGTELPVDLLRRLSRGLFEDDRPSEPIRHPSEDAARLLSVASGLKLQMPGLGEASLDRKSIKELQREPSRDQEA